MHRARARSLVSGGGIRCRLGTLCVVGLCGETPPVAAVGAGRLYSEALHGSHHPCPLQVGSVGSEEN